MMGTWKFGVLDEETLSRICVMGCRRCDGHVGVGQPYGLKIIEHVPWWKFWAKSARVDSYHLECANIEIQEQMIKLSLETKMVVSEGLEKIIREELRVPTEGRENEF